MHRIRRPTPDRGTVDIERAHAERIEYLGSMRGKGELAEALVKIRSGLGGERIDGAHTLKRLAPADAFGPLLIAIENEREDPVKIELLKALHWSVELDGAGLPEDAIPRLERLIIGESNVEVVAEAAMAVYHCSDDKADANEKLRQLSDNVKDALGDSDPVSRAVTGVMVHLWQIGAM